MRWFPAVLVSVLAAPLAAQSNAERIANDHYSRSHDYDLLHEKIELRNFDWDSTSFDGRVTISLRALRPAFDSVVLDAGHLLDIQSVADARGAALAHSSHGDTLVVRLARPAGFRDTVRFSIAYHAHIDNGHGLTFIKAEPGVAHRPQQIWSQGEDDNNHDWFPTYDFPNDKATWEIIATVPGGFTAVSNGSLLLDRKNRDGTRTMHWRQEQPTATYLASLIVAPLAKLRDTWRGVPVDYYVYREDSTLARPLFRVTPDMIEVYSNLTGVRYPWSKYAQTTVADFFGGMENVSATTLVDWLPDSAAYADRPWFRYILIPHELAHQWFGDYVTTANWANMWLNEGFAEFMPGQYWDAKLGRHAEDDYYLDEYRQFLQIDGRRRMPLASLGSNNIYPKGALVLRMLKRYLGEDRFWASVNRYLTDHRLGVAVTDDFRQAVLSATGENLDWFWEQWLYQAGYPEFEVTATVDSTAGGMSLSVRQTQVDSSRADSTGLRFTTPAVFRMPVSLRVATSSRDTTVRVWLDQREQTITIDGLGGPPTMVIFDDGNNILKTLKFDEPTSWLAAQIERDPDLWNRNWAIGQLASRTADSAAAAALARAARSADYFLTRQQAVAALAAFPAGVAVPALVDAMRDTSSAVREAALGALAGTGDPEALRLAQTAYAGDPSYGVRAAALLALVRLDPANSREYIRAGLSSHSYRDVILGSALRGIAETNDTTFVPDLERELRPGTFAQFVLASLAARGSAAAMDVLERHLDDERPSVRRGVLNAFERGMPAATAVAALRQTLPGITRQDVREGIERAIGRLEKAGSPNRN